MPSATPGIDALLSAAKYESEENEPGLDFWDVAPLLAGVGTGVGLAAVTGGLSLPTTLAAMPAFMAKGALASAGASLASTATANYGSGRPVLDDVTRNLGKDMAVGAAIDVIAPGVGKIIRNPVTAARAMSRTDQLAEIEKLGRSTLKQKIPDFERLVRAQLGLENNAELAQTASRRATEGFDDANRMASDVWSKARIKAAEKNLRKLRKNEAESADAVRLESEIADAKEYRKAWSAKRREAAKLRRESFAARKIPEGRQALEMGKDYLKMLRAPHRLFQSSDDPVYQAFGRSAELQTVGRQARLNIEEALNNLNTLGTPEARTKWRHFLEMSDAGPEAWVREGLDSGDVKLLDQARLAFQENAMLADAFEVYLKRPGKPGLSREIVRENYAPRLLKSEQDWLAEGGTKAARDKYVKEFGDDPFQVFGTRSAKTTYTGRTGADVPEELIENDLHKVLQRIGQRDEAVIGHAVAFGGRQIRNPRIGSGTEPSYVNQFLDEVMEYAAIRGDTDKLAYLQNYVRNEIMGVRHSAPFLRGVRDTSGRILLARAWMPQMGEMWKAWGYGGLRNISSGTKYIADHGGLRGPESFMAKAIQRVGSMGDQMVDMYGEGARSAITARMAQYTDKLARRAGLAPLVGHVVNAAKEADAIAKGAKWRGVHEQMFKEVMPSLTKEEAQKALAKAYADGMPEQFMLESVDNLMRRIFHVYSAGTTPTLLRGPAGSLMFQFRTFAVNTAEQFAQDIVRPISQGMKNRDFELWMYGMTRMARSGALVTGAGAAPITAFRMAMDANTNGFDDFDDFKGEWALRSLQQGASGIAGAGADILTGFAKAGWEQSPAEAERALSVFPASDIPPRVLRSSIGLFSGDPMRMANSAGDLAQMGARGARITSDFGRTTLGNLGRMGVGQAPQVDSMSWPLLGKILER